MTATNAQAAPGARLQRLLGFLDRDPGNLSLTADAAGAAFDEGQLELASSLIGQIEAASATTPTLQNLKGLIAIASGDYAVAETVFATLISQTPGDDSALAFNLAWSRAMRGDHEGALGVLDESVVASVPQAATLKIQMLHHLGRLEEALACGRECEALYPTDQKLMSALATVALDAEDLELARLYADRAGAEPDGLATMGMLMLHDSEVTGALDLFDRALEASPDDARAALGKGLGLMAEHEPAEAARWLDKGAQSFGDHLGSWVASGWAYFVAGDMATSRARFETALAHDDTFAETHGALAVLDVVEGQLESARRRTEVALRLDRKCFAAALAQSLLLTADGNPAAAERVRQVALNSPIGADGRTIAQTMAAMGSASGRKPG